MCGRTHLTIPALEVLRPRCHHKLEVSLGYLGYRKLYLKNKEEGGREGGRKISICVTQ